MNLKKALSHDQEPTAVSTELCPNPLDAVGAGVILAGQEHETGASAPGNLPMQYQTEPKNLNYISTIDFDLP